MKRHFLLSIFLLLLLGIGFFYSHTLHAAQPTEKTIPLDPSLYPDLVVVDSLHHKAYIAAHGDGNVSLPVTILDTLHDTISGILPISTARALAINSRANRLYAVDGVTKKLNIFDTVTNELVSTSSALMVSPFLLAVNESTSAVYAISQSPQAGGTITVIDGITGNQVANTIPFTDIPQAVAINALTNKLYIVTSGNNPQLVVFDGATNTIAADVPLTNPAADVAVDTVLNRIYIASDTSTNIAIIDGKTNTILTQLSMANMVPCAHTLTIDSLAHTLYAACFNGLSIIDTTKNTLLQQIPLIDDLPVSHAITSQYFTTDSVLNKLYIPLEETHEIAVVSLVSPPKLNPVSQQTAHEGSVLSIPIAFTDTVGTSWTSQIDFGDATPMHSEVSAVPQLSLQHVYQKPGSYTAKVTVINNTGAESSETIPITIQNVSPTVSLISLSQNLVPVGASISATAAFSDPGLQDTHTAFWDWGDGTTSQGIITQNEIQEIATGSHTYSKPGIFTISLTVTDNYGAATTNTFYYLAVSDIKSPEVVGEGSLQSPLGALVANRTLGGPLIIGIFVSNVQLNSGSLEIAYPLGNMYFHATNITSMVLNGNMATAQGTGVINHTGNFTFSLSLQDNTAFHRANMVRVKVWDTSSGISIYDSQDSATLQSFIPLLTSSFTLRP